MKAHPFLHSRLLISATKTIPTQGKQRKFCQRRDVFDDSVRASNFLWLMVQGKLSRRTHDVMQQYWSMEGPERQRHRVVSIGATETQVEAAFGRQSGMQGTIRPPFEHSAGVEKFTTYDATGVHSRLDVRGARITAN